MGEWSEYFEDFPEENPANWHNPEDDAEKRMGKYSEFFPNWREGQLTKAERAEVQIKIDAINAKAKKEEEDRANYIKELKSNPLFLTDVCPQCHLKELNIYKISDESYFGECQHCGVSADGVNDKVILDSISDTIWKQNTWSSPL